MTGVLHTARISTAKFIMGVREVMGLIPVGDSDISLSHACVMLDILSFTFNYQAQISPSSFTYHYP